MKTHLVTLFFGSVFERLFFLLAVAFFISALFSAATSFRGVLLLLICVNAKKEKTHILFHIVVTRRHIMVIVNK